MPDYTVLIVMPLSHHDGEWMAKMVDAGEGRALQLEGFSPDELKILSRRILAEALNLEGSSLGRAEKASLGAWRSVAEKVCGLRFDSVLDDAVVQQAVVKAFDEIKARLTETEADKRALQAEVDALKDKRSKLTVFVPTDEIERLKTEIAQLRAERDVQTRNAVRWKASAVALQAAMVATDTARQLDCTLSGYDND